MSPEVRQDRRIKYAISYKDKLGESTSNHDTLNSDDDSIIGAKEDNAFLEVLPPQVV